MSWRQRERRKEENMQSLGGKSGEWKEVEEVQPPWNRERQKEGVREMRPEK